MRHNAKKALMVDERYETIERQNRQLLDKLQHIMLADNGTLAPAAAGPGGAAAVRRVGPVSLNEQLRRHEQRRLTRENEVRAAPPRPAGAARWPGLGGAARTSQERRAADRRRDRLRAPRRAASAEHRAADHVAEARLFRAQA